jgi:hypothetical protein
MTTMHDWGLLSRPGAAERGAELDPVVGDAPKAD